MGMLTGAMKPASDTSVASESTIAPKINLRAIKSCVQRSLKRLGIYERTKASWIYDFYWTLADRRIVDDRRKELDFYRGLLVGFRNGDLIFDVGANQGYKTEVFLRLGATVVAVEPDDFSQEVLRQKFLGHRLKTKPVVIVGKAASAGSGVTRLWIDAPGSAMNTLSQKWAEALRVDATRFGQNLSFERWKAVQTVSLQDLVAAHGVPFFVKIDVEGHELSVLQGMERPVPYLSFEVNLPEFKVEGMECVRTLGRLAGDGEFNYTPNCRDGLLLKQWCLVEQFLPILDSCRDTSVEVFWRTHRCGLGAERR
jgi:FkbM family methyltransferase